MQGLTLDQIVVDMKGKALNAGKLMLLKVCAGSLIQEFQPCANQFEYAESREPKLN